MKFSKIGILVFTALFSFPATFVKAEPVSANTLEEYFGIYMLNKDRRSNQDKVLVKGDEKSGYSAEISYWRSLQSRDPAEEICNSYKWLLFGRGKYSHGAPEAFNQFASLQQVSLTFFDVESGTKVGKKRAEILPTSRVIPYLRIGVERRSTLARKVDWKDLANQMNKGKCAQLGNGHIDSKWFDEGYLKQGK